MNTKKILLWSAGSVLVVGLIIAPFLFFKWRSQSIILSDGTKLTLLGVTYGKHHVFAGGKTSPGRPTMMDSPTDTLCVWVQQQHAPNQWPQYQLIAYDKANTACAGYTTINYGSNPSGALNVVGIRFDAFPRRGGKIYFRVQEWNRQNGEQDIAKGQFAVSNPARRSFAKWTPQHLPITQEDGDLSMTLTRLVCGVDFSGPLNQAKADPKDKGVLAAFRIEQNGSAVTNWQPVKVESSDATGNHSSNRSWSNRRDNDEDVLVYQWGLWPDEPAWKLRVEFSRMAGFNDDELWTVTDIPLEAGSMNDFYRRDKSAAAFAETTLNGIKLKIFPAKQFTKEAPNTGMEAGFHIVAEPPPEDFRLTVVKVTDDRGRELEKFNWGWGGGDYRFAIRKIGDARSLNITLALHRSRYAEFTAKPAKQ